MSGSSDEKLLRRIRDLERELQHVKDEKAKIEDEKAKIMKEFEEFKAAHSITVDHLRQAMRIKPERTRSGKPVGAQQGHKGRSRRIPLRIDYFREYTPSHCPDCNTILRGKVIRHRSRTVTDIRLLTQAETTQYTLNGKWCPGCKKIVDPTVIGALPGARFGLNLMLLVMYLRLGLRLPGNKVCEYFATMHDVSICEGEVVNILRLLVNVYGSYYSTLEQLVRLARVKHTDSTSWRINGRNYFAWVFIAAGVVLYKIRKRNNHKVPLGVLGRARQGDTLVVDRHSAFRTLATKAGFLLQLCWSHILEDSRELKTHFGAEGRYVHRRLKAIFHNAKGLNHSATPEQFEQLKGMTIELTQRHYTHTKVRRFITTLTTRDIDNLFRFTTDPAIDPTNNISERELRAMVIIRKISNGSKSARGANATAMLLSIVQTFRLNKENPLAGLKRVLTIS
jgi:transposase